MKPPVLVTTAAAVIIAVGVAWWLVMPAPSATKPAPGPAANSSPTTSAPSTAPLPINPPAAAGPSTTPLAPAAIDPNDPRRELSTCIGDMVAHLDKGDLAGFLTAYAPPEQLKNLLEVNHLTVDQFVQRALQQPGFSDQMQRARETLHSIQFAKPDYNPAGDLASYVISPPPATGPKVLVFRKINGLWYIQN